MATIKIKDVKKIYQGNVVAVHDFNLDIKDKEFIVFVGPSGCGKSTTLRMVAGLEDISEGTVEIDGVVVNDLQPKDRHLSMVFQNYALYPHLTVYENMAFPLRLTKIPTYSDKTEADKAKVQVKLDAARKELKALEEEMADTALVEAAKAEVEAKVAEIEAKIADTRKKIEDLQAAKKEYIAKYVAKVDAKIEKIKPQLEGANETQTIKINTKISALIASKGKVDNSMKVANYNTKLSGLAYKIVELEDKIEDLKHAKLYENRLKDAEAKVKALETELVSPNVSYKKMSEEEIYSKITKTADMLGITQYLTRKPKALSGGQRQRVAIGRAMVKDSKVLLMDEPLSNLDAKLRNQMRAEIILLRKKIDTTFIYVTHDQTEAMTLGDRIVVMKDGYIMQVGTPVEVFDAPANLFVAQFIGAPMMNTVKTKLVEKDGEYSVEPFGVSLPVTGEKAKALKELGVKSRDVILGFRPEHVELVKTGGIPVTLEVNEMMGSELHLHVVTENGTTLVVRVPTMKLTDKERKEMVYGKKLNISFEGRVMHFFDPETEKSLLLK